VGEAFAAALHAAAFVVDGDRQRRFAQAVDRRTQRGELLRVAVVVLEQDDAADSGCIRRSRSASVSSRPATSIISGPMRQFDFMASPE
jgi:hypothetical protein